MRSKALLLFAGALLTGCAAGLNGDGPRQTIAEAHPITVDQQVVAIRIPVDGTRNGLGRTDLAQVDAFVSTYRTKGHGPITVTAPVGTETDRFAQQTAADVRTALHGAGVPYEAMRGASLTGGDDVVVSFQSYVATGPSCGGASSAGVGRRLAGARSAQFGCATQANLAAMIADPRDLHAGAAADGAGDGLLADAITARDELQPVVTNYQAERGQ